MSTRIHNAGEELLGRYKVLNYVDEGGMQQVYLAHDRSLNRNVALKVPKSVSAEKRFARSARVSAKVLHANVAATLDYFETGSRSYLIEEFITGETLSRRLERDFAYLDPHLAAHVFHHLAKGLAASHHAGVFHRDLKPSNIMVSTDPSLRQVKITDFGIAKMAEEEIADAFKDHASTTGSSTVMGALPYMAPEMMTDQHGATLPADIWALGAILYHLLTGDLPFGKGLPALPRILEATIPQKPLLLTLKNQFSPLTDDLWNIICVCLKKSPAERPTADQLVELCAALCYSDAPRSVGSIDEWLYNSYGYIEDDDSHRVFFHGASYYALVKPDVGRRVSFAHFPGAPKPRAFPVLPLRDAATVTSTNVEI